METQIEAEKCDEVPTSVVLSVADCVITDYSAIAIEAAVLDKPLYLIEHEPPCDTEQPFGISESAISFAFSFDSA